MLDRIVYQKVAEYTDLVNWRLKQIVSWIFRKKAWSDVTVLIWTTVKNIFAQLQFSEETHFVDYPVAFVKFDGVMIVAALVSCQLKTLRVNAASGHSIVSESHVNIDRNSHSPRLSEPLYEQMACHKSSVLLQCCSVINRYVAEILTQWANVVYCFGCKQSS